MFDRWQNWTAKQGNRLLIRFDAWFSSGRGVYQTLIVCLIIIVVEEVWPTLDPHWYWLLVLLTVYSAITQPALAQSGAATMSELRRIEEKQNADLAEHKAMLKEMHEIVKELKK